MKPRLNLIELDILSHLFRLDEEKKILRYAIFDGDLEKVKRVSKDIAWRKAEIRRLRALAERLRSESDQQPKAV